ncbi:MAG: ABC transporter permease [Acidobacteria bacterium]|nr:ABC transporter permease [Acidobacteriota bacterium]
MRIQPGESISIALDSVWKNRFRSGLTILGIVIGITTVVTVSSLLTGLQKGIVTFFEEFGPNNIFVNRYSGDPAQRPRQTELRRKPLLISYADSIRRFSPSVKDIGMQLFIPQLLGNQPLVAKVPGYESDRVNIVAYTANFFDITPRDLRSGRVYSQEEAERGAKVAVIGPSLAEVLFPDGSSLGKSIVVGGAEYYVIGVFAPAKGGFFGENQLDYVMAIPFETARMRYPQLENLFFTVRAKDGLRDQALEETRVVLRRLRHVPGDKPDDFSITTADQIIKSFNQITSAILIGSIALSGLGLLVGGIGVMNIMLVSVTERTREIGIRKAIGARKGDIIFQFLTEAVTLTGAGGIVGIVLSVCVTLLISVLVPSLPSEVPMWAVAAGFGTSVSVGIFFGVWPAVKAAKLDPVEALRYE